MASSRPTRVIHPSAKLSADNDGEIELTAHRKAIAAASAGVAIPSSLNPTAPTRNSASNPQSPTSACDLLPTVTAVSPRSTTSESNVNDPPLPLNRKRRHVVESEPESDTQAAPSSTSKSKKTKKRAKAGK